MAEPPPSAESETLTIFNNEVVIADYHAFIEQEIEVSANQRDAYWDYETSSLEAYLESMQPYRQDLIEFISVPDDCLLGQQPELVAEDYVTTLDGVDIFAWELRVCDGNLTSYALLSVPADAQDPLPMIVVLHGTCGSPERIMGLQGDDYHHEFGLSLAKNGYIVFAPLILTRPTENAEDCIQPTTDDRNQIDKRMLSLGYRLLGVEIGKLVSSLDYLSQYSAVDANTMGVYGISLGGLMALKWGAIDTRLETIVVSQYIEDREAKLVDIDYATAFWRYEYTDHILFEDYLNFYTDYELALMIIPRKLFIEVGSEDPRAATTVSMATRIQSAYTALELPADYVGYEIAEGHHEIFLQGSLGFLNRWMRE